MEQYKIYFSGTWSIENQKNVDKDIDLEAIDFEPPFGQFEVSGGKINWILDHIKPTDETIKMCNNIEVFNHEVSFDIYLFEKSEYKKKKNIKGTFIDALIYIQNEFNDG